MEEEFLRALDLGFEPCLDSAFPNSNNDAISSLTAEEDIESLLSSWADQEGTFSAKDDVNFDVDIDIVDYVLNELEVEPFFHSSPHDASNSSQTFTASPSSSSSSSSFSPEDNSSQQEPLSCVSALEDHNYMLTKLPEIEAVQKPAALDKSFSGIPVKTQPITRRLPESAVEKDPPKFAPPPTKRTKLTGESCCSDSSKKKSFPKLILSPEEERLCEKDGIVLPSHYPLTRQEEASLRKIRRKIRNKISAQSSRKRKRDYMDGMETRATETEVENRKLKEHVSLLESQNRTLISLLKRMQNLIVATRNGFVQSAAAAPHASATTLLVVLFSVALIAVPGLKEQYGAPTPLQTPNVPGRIITPGQSRSLLQYIGRNKECDSLRCTLDKIAHVKIKEETADVYDAAAAEYLEKRNSNASKTVSAVPVQQF